MVRDALVRTRSISIIRALHRQHGYRVSSGSAEHFVHRVQSLPLPGRQRSVVAPLLALMRPLNGQLTYSDATIEHLAVQDRACRACALSPASVPSPPPPSSPPSMMRSASTTHISSKPTSASCPASTALARRSAGLRCATDDFRVCVARLAVAGPQGGDGRQRAGSLLKFVTLRSTTALTAWARTPFSPELLTPSGSAAG